MSEQATTNATETGDSTDHHQERRNVYAELKAEIEKGRADIEQQKRDEAFKQYAGYGHEYQRVNNERAQGAKITVEQFGPVTIIASINVDPLTGKAIDGHDYRPEAQSMKDIEVAWQHYLATTPPEQRVVIFEGDRIPVDKFGSRDEVISSRTESGLMQFLANQSGVESIGGEPLDSAVASELEKLGQSKEFTALLFTLREQAMHGSNKPLPGDISMHLYFHLAECGVDGFKIFSEDEKNFLKAHPDELSNIKRQIEPFINEWNETLQKSGVPTLGMDAEGNIAFSANITTGELAAKCNPVGETDLSHRFAEITKIRDKQIFETIADASKTGKKPFVVYGGSHVVTLDPVLQQYYTST